MSDELAAEKAAHDKTRAQLADVMSEGGSYRALQVKLDEQLELHVTKNALQARQLDEANAKTEAVRQQLVELREAHAKDIATIKTQADFQVGQFQLQHAEAVAILSQSPAEREAKALAAQEIAALQAKHQAALANLGK